MNSNGAAQLAFAAEFASFLVAVTGLATALRPGVLSRTPWSRSALATGFLAWGVAAFLRGAVIVPDADRLLLQGLRIAALVAFAVGAIRWNGRRSAVVFVVGLALAAASVIAVRTGNEMSADALRLGSAALFAAALVLVARRSMASRIAVDAALLVLGVVLVVALAVSITVADNVDGEALTRYGSRAAGEADAAGAEARTALGPARLVAAVLGSESGPTLQRVSVGGALEPADLDDLAGGLGRVVGSDLLDIDDPVVLVGVSGMPLASSPDDLSSAARLALAGDPVVLDAIAAGAERQGMTVIGSNAYALGVAPVVLRPDGAPQTTVAIAVVARQIDDTYLRVLGTGGEDLSFALATTSQVLARSGRGVSDDQAARIAASVIERGARPRRRLADGFVAASPVIGSDGQPVAALLVVAPASAAIATQEDLFRTLFVVALAAALLAVAIGVLVGERIGSGLAALTGAARAMQAGSLEPETVSAEVPTGSGDDVGVLGGAFTTMAGSIRQMTGELRAAAQDEARLRARLEAVISGMSEALFAMDANGTLIELNRAAEVLLDVDRRRVVGAPAAQALAWRMPDGSAVPFDRVDLLDGEAMAADVAVGAGSIPVVLTSGALVDAEGVDAGTVLVLRDVRREREVDDLKSSILANIGHELRTPLTPIRGYAGMLRDRSLDEDRTRSFAGEILDGVTQLERVVDQLVTFATIAAGSLHLEVTDVAVAELADGFRERWNPRMDREHELVVDVDGGLNHVQVDRDLFDRAVDELIDNALKYSPDGGPIEVRLTPSVRADEATEPRGSSLETNNLMVTVTDRGIGMATDRVADLADPFTQGDASATRRFNGLGLGLACADRIVAAHGGRLTFASTEHRGTTVSIVLGAPAGSEEGS